MQLQALWHVECNLSLCFSLFFHTAPSALQRRSMSTERRPWVKTGWLWTERSGKNRDGHNGGCSSHTDLRLSKNSRLPASILSITLIYGLGAAIELGEREALVAFRMGDSLIAQNAYLLGLVSFCQLAFTQRAVIGTKSCSNQDHTPLRSDATYSLPGKEIEPSRRVSTNVWPDTDRTTLAPGPPRSAVTVNGLFVPAPTPVTVAVPVKTTDSPWRLAAVIGPVTYMMLLSKLPLPCVPAGELGMSARQSKWPDPFLKLIPSRVMTGAVPGPPPVRMLVPAP